MYRSAVVQEGLNWVVPFEWADWVSSQEAKELFAEEKLAADNTSAFIALDCKLSQGSFMILPVAAFL